LCKKKGDRSGLFNLSKSAQRILAHFLSNTSALKKERQEELEPLVDRVTAFIASIAALLSP